VSISRCSAVARYGRRNLSAKCESIKPRSHLSSKSLDTDGSKSSRSRGPLNGMEHSATNLRTLSGILAIRMLLRKRHSSCRNPRDVRWSDQQAFFVYFGFRKARSQPRLCRERVHTESFHVERASVQQRLQSESTAYVVSPSR
jgi:hypothetical protein